MYAILVNLADDVADTVLAFFHQNSLEIVSRSLYFCTTAFQRGEADDAVTYRAKNTELLGLMKRKPDSPLLLDLTAREQP